MTEITAKHLQEEIDSLTGCSPSFYGIMKSLKTFETGISKAELYQKNANLNSEQAAVVMLLRDLQSSVKECLQFAGTEIQELPLGLTVLEKPLAKDFLFKRKKNIDEHDPQKSKKQELFDQMLQQVEKVKTVPECSAVRKLEFQYAQQEKAYNKIKSEFEQWQAGKKKYSSVDEMSKAKRDYESGQKDLDKLSQKIEAARRVRRDGQDEDSDDGEIWTQPQKQTSFFIVAKPAGNFSRGKSNWGDNLTSAQKMMAEMISDTSNDISEVASQPNVSHPSKMKIDKSEYPSLKQTTGTVNKSIVKESKKEADDGFQIVTNKKNKAGFVVTKKAPIKKEEAKQHDDEEDDDDVFAQPPTSNPSTKKVGGAGSGAAKGGRNKKKKSEKEDEDLAVAAAEVGEQRKANSQSAVFLKLVSKTFESSVLKQYAKYAIGPCKKPGLVLEELRVRLAPRSALGVVLIVDWEDFFQGLYS